ncbi:hypothetical protein PR202_ga25100 [Eleusine coracana subsp. coracana]|uniref:F-box domain-containing protein n=1 Tax=Eleusine coracana subsp. coracana TaxID=191504 RepID=A0AAV5DAH1_ELECO|nr:hypothetical protein QOZ80_9AG0671040 [Eleusine coracana subsp. coracana]GJN07281.1 hypothetical protein PR202_ga25100 [Eleusine coracana subsp. coracana]
MSRGGTVISDLPDDLLRRILFFAPAKEGASTAVLSRRWRRLWLSSGAVNIHWPADKRLCTSKQWRSLFDVPEAALAAVHAHGPVRRLTFHGGVELYRSEPYTIVAALSHPAARHVEELRFTVVQDDEAAGGKHGNKPWRRGKYTLHLGDLPSEDLGTLHLARCSISSNLMPPPAELAFPWLAVLRMEACTVFMEQLNRVIDAAPRLATLHIERTWLMLFGVVEEVVRANKQAPWSWSSRLRGPAVTALVLVDCEWPNYVRMDLDMPRLRYFRYKGHVPQLSLLGSSPAVNIAQVDVHFMEEEVNNTAGGGGGGDAMTTTRDRMRSFFWKFIQCFYNASILKVRLDYLIEHVAVAKEDQDEIICPNKFFSNLDRLEIEAPHIASSDGTALALLLSCGS